MGRPSSYSEDLGDMICALMMEGKSLNTICKLDTMPVKSTVLLWAAKGERGVDPYKGFSVQYRRAREVQAEAHMDEIVEIADDDSQDRIFIEDKDGNARMSINSEFVQRSKIRIEARLKAASKFYPKRYSDKHDINLGGQSDNPVEANLTVTFVKPE